MQHGQFQTVTGQFQPIFNFLCPAFSGGTSWVINFVRLRLFFVFSHSQKQKKKSSYMLFFSILSHLCLVLSAYADFMILFGRAINFQIRTKLSAGIHPRLRETARYMPFFSIALTLFCFFGQFGHNSDIIRTFREKYIWKTLYLPHF